MSFCIVEHKMKKYRTKTGPQFFFHVVKFIDYNNLIEYIFLIAAIFTLTLYISMLLFFSVYNVREE